MTLTPSFLFDVERRMRIVGAQEYQRLLGALYWQQLAKQVPSNGKSERISWLMDTAGIQYVDRLGSTIEFEELAVNTMEYTAKTATGGYQLNKNQLSDVDGGGISLASEWARQIGAYAAYWPQKQVVDAIRKGTAAASLAYDGKVFFAVDHPVDPFDTSIGTYANRLTAGVLANGSPGACPIDVTNAATLDVAYVNFQKVISYVNGGLTMPNGVDPRMLKARRIFYPTALAARVAQLTNAKFIAAAASAGGGSQDVESTISSWNLQTPVECPELGAAFGGSDTTYYVAAESILSDQVGALLYINREPFEVVYNTGITDAALQRANKVQWTTRGRNVVGYGHPYLLFRVEAT